MMSMVFYRWKVDASECQDHDHSPSGELLLLRVEPTGQENMFRYLNCDMRERRRVANGQLTHCCCTEHYPTFQSMFDGCQLDFRNNKNNPLAQTKCGGWGPKHILHEEMVAITQPVSSKISYVSRSTEALLPNIPHEPSGAINPRPIRTLSSSLYM
jgi:hypothetical protein